MIYLAGFKTLFGIYIINNRIIKYSSNLPKKFGFSEIDPTQYKNSRQELYFRTNEKLLIAYTSLAFIR